MAAFFIFILLPKFLYSFIVLALFSCGRQKQQAPAISFYYWKSNFKLDSTEKKCLAENDCKKIYLKYFDVVRENGKIKPVSIIHFNEFPAAGVVPVIFIANSVFISLSREESDTLVSKVIGLIAAINKSIGFKTYEVQFDCDWTQKTRDNYFLFLKKYKGTAHKPASATIRLHQVKYKAITGIPPVSNGILMFYNMGKIGADTSNSIYNAGSADRYLGYIKEYPLPLSLALPVFGWSIQLRDNKVIELLNKSITSEDLNDTSFVTLHGKFYKVKQDGFKKGFYFKKDDLIKIERVEEGQLLSIVNSLKRKMNAPAEIIFYDLDNVNLKQYDKQLFKKISNSFN